MGTHPIFESDFDCLTEMAEHGAALQTYNNELVKCIEDLNRRRDEASKSSKLKRKSSSTILRFCTNDFRKSILRLRDKCKSEMNTIRRLRRPKELIRKFLKHRRLC